MEMRFLSEDGADVEPPEKANGARAGPIRVWAAKRRGIYDVTKRPRNPFKYGKDHHVTQEREIMADEKQAADDNGKPQDKQTETISKMPPPVPGDVGEAEETGGVMIEEVVAPEPPKLIVSTMLRYEHRVLPLKAKNEADLDELEKLLNELGAQGFKFMPSVFVGDDIGAIFMQRQVYVVNGSGDPAAALVGAEQRDNAELLDSLVSEAS